MKLVVFPLVFMLGLSLVIIVFGSDLGSFGYGQVRTGYLNSDGTIGVLYDEEDHPVCFLNGTAIGESGYLEIREDTVRYDKYHVSVGRDTNWWWWNVSDVGLPEVNYIWQPHPAGWSYPCYPLFDELSTDSDVDAVLSFYSGTSLGLIALVVALMGVAGIVGLHILGSGISEISVGVVVKGTAMIAVWLLSTAVCYDYLVGVNGQVGLPFGIGSLVYWSCTAVYTVGFVGNIT